MIGDYILQVDSSKGMFTTSGEVVFLNNEEEYKEFISDNLGKDFSDCIAMEKVISVEAYDLFEDLCSACEDIENMTAYGTKNPVLELKKYRNNFKLLQRCRDLIEKLIE